MNTASDTDFDIWVDSSIETLVANVNQRFTDPRDVTAALEIIGDKLVEIAREQLP